MDETRDHTHDDATRASTPEDSPRLTSVPDRIGPYRVLSKLGEGGMGVVYEAEQQSPRRHVAVKVIRGGRFVDDAQLRMFQREAETLGRLKHPGIGAIYESGRTEDGQHYFAMELVRGRTLGAYLRERVPDGALTPDEVRFRLELFRSIADAVHYAHQRGVIHRDLKPSNIVVTEAPAGDASSRGALPEVKILDFGLARITDADVQASLVSEVGSVKGTLPYMSPEQARGNPAEIDVRTDVYSLGVILYEMLAGRLPREIPTVSMLEALRVIAEAPPRPLRETFRGTKRLDPDVETICHKALEREADARYGSAAALSEDVGRYLSSQPIQARPPSTLYQLGKLVKRNKLPTAFAATVVLLLVGLAATMSVLRGQAEHARAEAQARADELERASGFMSSMLQNVDPVRMGGDLRKDLDDKVAAAGSLDRVNFVDVSTGLVAREMLAPSDSLIGVQLSGDPALAARLYQTIGEAYTWGLLLYDPGVESLRRAVDAARQAFGDEGEAKLAADLDLANALKRNGSYDEALKILEGDLAIRKRTLDEDDPRILALETDRADALRYQRHYDEAEATYRELIPRLRRVLGNDDMTVYTALNDLALAIVHDPAKRPEAEKLYREAIEGEERLLGPGDSETINTRQNLARLIATRDPEEGISYMQDLLDVERKNLGDESDLTLQTLGTLGIVLQNVGKPEEALEVATEVVRAEKKVRGLTPRAASAMVTQATCLGGLKRYAEADQVLLELERELGDHPAAEFDGVRQLMLYNLACTAALQGARKEGLSRLRAAVDGGFRKADVIAGDPDLSSLHGPEFDAIVARARAAQERDQ